MRRLLLTVVLAALASDAWSQDATAFDPDRLVDVFVVAGQSNAVGTGVVEHLPDGFEVPANVRLLGAAALGSRPTFGPELGLAERVGRALPDRRIAIVKHAVSGTSLHTAWVPGEGDWDRASFGPQFRRFLAMLERDLGALRAAGDEPVLRGLVWVQGEADARFDAPDGAAAAYRDRLAHFVRRVREETGVADLPFAIAQVLPKPVERMTHRDTVRAAQREVAATVPWTALIETDGLSLRADEPGTKLPDDVVHFGTDGNLEIGRHAASALLGWFDEHVAASGEDAAFVSLFDGRELTGWVDVNGAPTTWRVEDGMIRCTGKPICVLRTARMYENFVLELEWRHLRSQGNAGVFVWSDPLTAVGQPFTRAVECQVLDGREGAGFTSDGDVFPIHGAVMTPENGRGGSRAFPAEARSRPSPRWNHYRITCIDGAISLAVNGKVVTRGHSVSPRKGYLCLESEGSPVDFRNLRLRELPPSSPPAAGDEVAALSHGFENLYDGDSLAGWRYEPAHEDAYRSADWRIALTGPAPVLWSEPRFGQVEVIVDWRVGEGEGATARLHVGGVGGLRFDLRADGTVSIPRAGPFVVELFTDEAGTGDGRWHRLRVRVASKSLGVEVDGEERTALALPDSSFDGPIGIEAVSGEVTLANLYVRALD